jgi:hypothetical protein
MVQRSSLNAWMADTIIPHSLLQRVTTIFALICGVTGLYRYYKGRSKSRMLLFLGVGFIGTTFIDAYHTVVTTAFFQTMYPDIPHSVAEWSWLSTRFYLSLLFLISLPRLFRNQNYEVKNRKVTPRTVYITVAILTLLNFLFFILVRKPYPVYPDHLIARPWEIAVGVIFLISLIGYLIKGGWKTEHISFWIVLFLITSVATQFFFIGLSKHGMDALYLGAHLMKIISYIMVYIAVSR